MPLPAKLNPRSCFYRATTLLQQNIVNNSLIRPSHPFKEAGTGRGCYCPLRGRSYWPLISTLDPACLVPLQDNLASHLGHRVAAMSMALSTLSCTPAFTKQDRVCNLVTTYIDHYQMLFSCSLSTNANRTSFVFGVQQKILSLALLIHVCTISIYFFVRFTWSQYNSTVQFRVLI